MEVRDKQCVESPYYASFIQAHDVFESISQITKDSFVGCALRTYIPNTEFYFLESAMHQRAEVRYLNLVSA